MATITLTQSRTTTRTGLRLAGLFLFALAAQFMIAIMLAASMAPGYDIAGGAISDLGTFPETATLFNVSLVAVGGLNVAGGFLLQRATGRGWILPVFAIAGNPAVFGAIGHGGAERMIVYPAMLWMLAFGGYLMGSREADAA